MGGFENGEVGVFYLNQIEHKKARPVSLGEVEGQVEFLNRELIRLILFHDHTYYRAH